MVLQLQHMVRNHQQLNDAQKSTSVTSLPKESQEHPLHSPKKSWGEKQLEHLSQQNIFRESLPSYSQDVPFDISE